MSIPQHDAGDSGPHVPLWRTPSDLVLCWFLLIAGFYLITEHTAHVFALPYLLLLACPLMHLFMHHGHGDHDSSDAKGGMP